MLCVITKFEALEVIHLFNEQAVFASMDFAAILLAYVVPLTLLVKLAKIIATELTVIYSLSLVRYFIATYANRENAFELI